jgi:hypothetical protein
MEAQPLSPSAISAVAVSHAEVALIVMTVASRTVADAGAEPGI